MPSRVDEPQKVAEQAAMLANRIAKRRRHLGKWAKREDVTCYRLYDRDIPEIPVVVDWLDGHLHVAEYHGSERPESWLDEMAAAVAMRLGVADHRVVLKRRQRQRGLNQYEKISQRGARIIVSEGGHRFWLNLTDYLDVGLFLDHRITRGLVAAEATGKRFLNLFSYTASFSVYAAAAGASSSLSVDMSNTYTEWARDNFELNDVDQSRHLLIRDNVLSFVDGLPRTPQFDLVVVDPPTFSNSKKMDEHFDVQRDHAELLAQVGRRLSLGGVIYFSSNLRRFKLDDAGISGFEIAELTEKTTPEDFQGRRAHRSYRLVKV